MKPERKIQRNSSGTKGRNCGRRGLFSFTRNNEVAVLRAENETLNERNEQVNAAYEDLKRAFDRLIKRTELLEDLTAVFVPDRKRYDIWQEGKRW